MRRDFRWSAMFVGLFATGVVGTGTTRAQELLPPAEAEAIAILRRLEHRLSAAASRARSAGADLPFPAARTVVSNFVGDLSRQGVHASSRDGAFAVGSYLFRCVVGARDEVIGDDSPPQAGPGDVWIAYAWPSGTESERSRTFMLSSFGALLTIADGADYAGFDAPPPLVAGLGSGGRGTLADLLQLPGKGAAGDHWSVADPRSFGELVVSAVDERDQPVTDVRVVVSPSIDGPAGIAVEVLLDSAESRVKGPRVAHAQVLVLGRVEVLPGEFILSPACYEADGERDELRIRLRDGWRRDLEARVSESVLISVLKNISSAQAQCQASAVIDANSNGAGEYGFFAELAGGVAVRSSADGDVGERKVSPPVLSRKLGDVRGGCIEFRGYRFAMYLPGAKRQPVGENADGGGAEVRVDPPLAEVLWCCYAWPLRAGETGRRAFFVNQSGDVLACPNTDGRYSGDSAPAPNAAFAAGAAPTMDMPLAVQSLGQDGQRWIVVN